MKDLKYWLEAKDLSLDEDILRGARELISSTAVFIADNGAPIKTADGKFIWTPDRIQAYFVVSSPWYMDADTQQPLKHKRFLTRSAVALNTLINLVVLKNNEINIILAKCKDDIMNLIGTIAKADTKNHLVTNGDGWKIAVDKCFNGDDTDKAILYLLSTDDSNMKIKIPSPNFDKMLGAGFEKEWEALREKIHLDMGKLLDNVKAATAASEVDLGSLGIAKFDSVSEDGNTLNFTIKQDAISKTVNDLSAIENKVDQSLSEMEKIASETSDEILEAIKKNSPAPNPPTNRTAAVSSGDSGMSSIGKAAIGVGVVAGAAAIGYGLYRAYNALFVDTEVTSGNSIVDMDNPLGL